MCRDWTLTELSALTLADLEALWLTPAECSIPSGRYQGHMLARIEHPTSRRWLWRWSEGLGFEWLPFGIDFDRRLWFFVSTRIAMGRFQMQPGPSRWRETRIIGLHYEPSRLPHFVRNLLYDEVRPLSARWMLGIGGINAERGQGDHFYFALKRLED